MNNYQYKVLDILHNAEKYHDAYYKAETFRGPSLYFHRRTLEMANSDNFELYLEFIYATLASWGMHRMGKGGSKMQSFDVFKRSVLGIKDKIEEAKKINYQNVTNSDWGLLEKIFRGIKVMASGTSIVGNSKVMAHMIPNIVPPIDREYTLKYLKGNTNIRNGLDYEWKLMKEIISEFFIPVAKDTEFVKKANTWIANQPEYPWDTSIFKVIDNLVIGASKKVKKPNKSLQRMAYSHHPA
ncbi:MAG: hypothetical protein HXY53_07560 [Nitrospirae bacterium]|nr:hypothetical protein [Nitrospirota bacterium]